MKVSPCFDGNDLESSRCYWEFVYSWSPKVKQFKMHGNGETPYVLLHVSCKNVKQPF